MKVEVRSWAKWDEDGLIEIKVDRNILRDFIKEYEKMIALEVGNKNYSLVSELILKRKLLVEKFEEYNGTTDR